MVSQKKATHIGLSFCVNTTIREGAENTSIGSLTHENLVAIPRAFLGTQK